MTTDAKQIEAVLAVHRVCVLNTTVDCTCGWKLAGSDDMPLGEFLRAHDAHVAALVAAIATDGLAGRACVIKERSDSDGTWEECVTHKSLIPCDGEATPAEVIEAIEETFLGQLPSKALSYCAQEDVNAGLDAMRERFGLEDRR